MVLWDWQDIYSSCARSTRRKRRLQPLRSKPKLRNCVLVVVLRPRESRCLTIRLTGQNNCGTIGLSSLQKTPTDRGRRRARGRESKLRGRLKERLRHFNL